MVGKGDGGGYFQITTSVPLCRSPYADAAADAPELGASSATPDSDDKEIIEAALSSALATKTTGRKRALTLTVRGTPSESLAYVFYRNLFLISVRATLPTSVLPADKFNALVDRAVQELVPTIDVQNFGDCGTIYVSVDEKAVDKNKDAKAGAIQLIRGVGRVARENCANKPGPDTEPPASHAQQTIVYPPGFWK